MFFVEDADEIACVIDEKHDVEDAVFLDELGEVFSCDRNRLLGNRRE